MSIRDARSFCQMMEQDQTLLGAIGRDDELVSLGQARGLEFTTDELDEVRGAGARSAHGVSGGKRSGDHLNLSRKAFPKSVLKSSVWPAPDW